MPLTDPKPRLIAIITAVVAILAVCLMVLWLDRILWDHGPRLLGVSTATLGGIVLAAWLTWQGYEKFWKSRDNSPGIRTFRTKDPDSESRSNRN